MTGTTDYELLQRMKTGDEEAFVTLYRRRQGNVYRFALRMCGSETIAEDVTQEVFMVLMREAEKFDVRRAQLTTWLMGIARNQVLKHLERERRWVGFGDDEDEMDFVFQGADPFAAFAHKLTVEKVRQAVLTLPPHYREVVVLCELQELSYAETADVLGCAIGTVRSRLHRGKAILSETLRETEPSRETSSLTLPQTTPCLL
jgi:RNA polymerase sigma-70 factor, ECF subfamily